MGGVRGVRGVLGGPREIAARRTNWTARWSQETRPRAFGDGADASHVNILASGGLDGTIQVWDVR